MFESIFGVMTSTQIAWLLLGFIGQALFSMRFIVQWFQSEKQKKSVIPVHFWYYSIAGGLTLLTYALYRQDPVFIVGQLTGVFIYSRNLYFIAQEKSGEKSSTKSKEECDKENQDLEGLNKDLLEKNQVLENENKVLQAQLDKLQA